MQKLELQKIIDRYELDVHEVAKKLYPSAKYPKLAIDRVISGDALLNSEQVALLSAITGVPIGFLYSGGDWTWNGTAKENILSFSTEDYTAELDTNTWTTKIYHKGSLFHDAVIHSGSVPLSEYLSTLSNLIVKYKSNEQQS